MDTLYKILLLIGCFIISYLFGTISNGIFLGLKFFGKDVRNYGSHNPGGTNVGRVFGLKVGFVCILLDMFKTIIPMYICFFTLKYCPVISEYTLGSLAICQIGYLVSGLGATVGHCFPCWYKFKGGKAVSCFTGMLLGTSWYLAAIGLVIYLSVLKIQKRVSFTSIFIAIVMPAISISLLYLPNYFMNFGMLATPYFTLTLSIIGILLIIRHIPNIKRMLNGTESKIKWMK